MAVSSSRGIVLASLIVITVQCFGYCDAIWCFNCHSTTKSGCGDDFTIPTSDALSRVDCPGTCVKRRGERSSGGVRRVEIHRLCILRREEGCYDENKNNLDVYSCACNTNFCNKSSRNSVPTFLVIFISICAYFTTELKKCF